MSAVDDDGESSNSEMLEVNDEQLDHDKKEELRKERAKQLGYEPQKEIVYNKLLPYSGELKCLLFVYLCLTY